MCEPADRVIPESLLRQSVRCGEVGMLSDIIRDVRYFWNKKCFAAGIPLMTLLSYLTLVIRPTIGVDDTSFKLYYVDGVSPAMGRWCTYLINKLFPLDHNPHFIEAISLVILCVSVTLWCVVFYRMFGEKISTIGYAVFGGVMLSSPILSEVVVWSLHDGIFTGYGVTALAVLCGMEAFKAREDKRRNGVNIRIIPLLLSGVFLTVALGFYEAFMIVYLMAMVMNFLLIRCLNKEGYGRRPFEWLAKTTGICVWTMILRECMINGIVAFFHLEGRKDVLDTRNISDIFRSFGTDGEELWKILKEFFVKYYVHGIVYTPVLILVFAVGILGVWGLLYAVRKKDGWIFLSVLGIALLPWVMVFLEGHATFYRSSEYVPLLTGFAVLLSAYEVKKQDKKPLRAAAAFCAAVLLYRQSYEMNLWLYVDAAKYEDDKRTAGAVALEIIRDCDESKPICVVGHYLTPPSLLSRLYTPYWSKKYKLTEWLVRAIDDEIFEKYNTPYGYAAAETPQISLINWASQAFYHTDMELIKFWEMIGFDLVEDGNFEHYLDAGEMMREAPAWPEEGAIVEMEDYIIVNFGNIG